MVDVRRLVAGIASVVLMVGVFASPSGAVAAPLPTDPPVVSAEASDDELAVAAAADEDATSQVQEKPSVGAKESSPDPKQEEPKPSADPKGDADASADDASPKPTPPTDAPSVKPSIGDDGVSVLPKPSDARDEDAKSSGSQAKSSESDQDAAPAADGGSASPDGDSISGDGPARSDDGVSADGGGLVPASVPIQPLASGQLSKIIANVVADGTIAANGPVVVNGVTLDSADDNFSVAVWDTVEYSIAVTYGPMVSGGDTLSLVGVLPPGVTWQSGSYSGESCDRPSTGYNNTSTFTCNWTAGDENMKTFSWFARPGAPWANGTSFAPEFRDGNGTSSATAPSVDVVSAFNYNVVFSGVSSTANQILQRPGQPDEVGFVVLIQVDAVGVGNDVTHRGMEAVGAYSFDMRVPDGVLLWSCESDTTCDQPAGAGGVIHVAPPGGFRSDSSTSMRRQDVRLFVPYSLVVPGVTFVGQVQVLGFDPASVSGASNFGDGIVSGQEPDAVCGAGGLCRTFSVLLRNDVVLAQRITFGRAAGTTSALFGAGNDYGGTTLSGRARVVPGESFAPSLEVLNGSNAGVAMTGVGSCVSWDRSFAELTGEARVGGPISMPGSFNSSSWTSSLMAGAVMPSSDYEVKYAAVTGLTLGSFDCADGAATWVDDPSDAVGGAGAVNAVRLTLNPGVSVGIGTAYGLALPMRRTTTEQSLALAPGAPITFYNRQMANELASPASVSGWVGADPAFVLASTRVRSGASWVTSSTGAAGDEVVFRVTPTVVGPAADIDTVATNTWISLTFNSACVDVAATVAALTAYGAELTSPGDGLAACGPAASNGPVITLSLGDVTAPGSANPSKITDSAIGGNETYIGAPIEVPVVLSTRTPQGAAVTMSTQISSTNSTNIVGVASSSQVTVNTPQTFTARKSAATSRLGLVDPGESFTYTHLLSNTQSGDYQEVSFVDVVPFAGDPRLGARADALAGGGRLTVTGVSASMVDGAGVSQPVEVSCSTLDPATIYASLATDKSGGQIQDWTDCSAEVPAGTTAVRFVTGVPLASMAMVTGSITVKAPVLAVGGYLVNDMSYDAPAASGSGLMDQRGFVGVPVELLSSSAVLSGTVARDLNFNDTFDEVGPTGDGWWPADDVVRLLTSAGDPVIDLVSGEPYTAVVAADGQFTFGVIPSGDFRLALSADDAPSSDWRLLTTTPITVPVSSTTAAEVLYQEIVPDPELNADTGKVGVGGTVRVDVTANDWLWEPSVSTVSTDQLVLEGDGITDRGGTYVLADAEGEKYENQPQVEYRAPEVWPSEEEGTSYTDSFSYSWTNVVGEKRSATVTVTVQKPPEAVGGTVRVPVASGEVTYRLPALDVETAGESWTVALSDAPQPPGVTVTMDPDDGSFIVVTNGAEARTYQVVAVVTDDLQQTVEVPLTVIVQAPPEAVGGTVRVPVTSGEVTYRLPALEVETDGESSTVALSDAPQPPGVTVTMDPDDGSFIVVTDHAEAKTYQVVAVVTDDLQQSVDVPLTVIVQAPPEAVGGTVRVPVTSGDVTYRLPALEVETDGESSTVALSDAPQPPGVTVTMDPDDGSFIVVTDHAEAKTYQVVAVVTDDLQQTADVPLTVIVQAPPVVTGVDEVIVPLGGTHEFLMTVTTEGSIADTGTQGVPVGASARAYPDGSVAFDAGTLDPGVYSFEASWTDSLGQSTPATFTVTVQDRPTAEGGEHTIGVANGNGTIKSVELWGDPKHDPEVLSAKIDPAKTVRGDITTDDGDLASVSAKVDLTTGRVVFAADVPGTYKVPVTYYDNLGQWVEVEFTVTVRSLEVVGEVTSTVKVGERYSFLPVVNHPDDVVSRVILTPPGQGTVSIDEKTGEVRYDATGAQAGVYTYEIIWTDDLGQSVTLIHNVTVWDETPPPVPTPTPTPPTPTPTPPTPTPPTPSPTPSPIVGTGGTVTGDLPGAGAAGLALTGIAVLFGAAWILGRLRGGGPGR